MGNSILKGFFFLKDILSAFLIAECIIEKYLYFNPIGYENSLNSSQQNDLSNAKTYLLNIINKNDEVIKLKMIHLKPLK